MAEHESEHSPVAVEPSSAEAPTIETSKGISALRGDVPVEDGGEPTASRSLREALFGEEKLLEQERLTKRSKWSNWTVLAMLVLCFFVLIQFQILPNRGRTQHFAAEDSRVLDQVQLQQLGGSGQLTLQDLAGDVVIMCFWGPWQEGSRRLMPAIDDVVQRCQANSNVRFLSVACGRAEPDDLAELYNETHEYLRASGLSMRVYADPHGLTRRAVERAAGFDGLPTTLLIDRQGRIRAAWHRPDPEMADDIRERLDDLLHGPYNDIQ
jgi:hypothetical protein